MAALIDKPAVTKRLSTAILILCDSISDKTLCLPPFSLYPTGSSFFPVGVVFMVSITTDYISAGGNRHPAAADWDVQSGVLAFGADNNVALWDPRVCIYWIYTHWSYRISFCSSWVLTVLRI